MQAIQSASTFFFSMMSLKVWFFEFLWYWIFILLICYIVHLLFTTDYNNSLHSFYKNTGFAPTINNDGCRPSKSYKLAHTLVWPLSVHYPAAWRPGHVYTPTPPHSWCRAPETGAGRCCKGRNWRRCGLACSGPLTGPRSWCTGRSHQHFGLWLVVPVTLKESRGNAKVKRYFNRSNNSKRVEKKCKS